MWATLVAIGAKQWETRSWHTWYRGPIAIHAAKAFPKDASYLCGAYGHPISEALLDALGHLSWMTKDGRCDLPRGAVIATAELTACLHIDGAEVMTDTERAFGNYEPGRYRWQLTNVKRLAEPIPARGVLGIWNWDAMYPLGEDGRLCIRGCGRYAVPDTGNRCMFCGKEKFG